MGAPPRVAIIGGGVSGLAAGHFLRRQLSELRTEAEVHFYEKSPRLGGVIRTLEKSDCLLEGGPEAFLLMDPAMREIVQALDLEPELVGQREAGVSLLKDRRLQPFPAAAVGLRPITPRALWMLTSLDLQGALRAAVEPLIPRFDRDPDLKTFFCRRLGHSFWNEIAQPLLRAIYGEECGGLSTAVHLKRLFGMEQRWGSLWRGRHDSRGRAGGGAGLFAFRRGCETLIDRLIRSAVNRTHLYLECGDLRVRSTPLGKYRVSGWERQDTYDALILAAPAFAAAQLLSSIAPGLVPALKRIRYAGSRTVYLAYQRDEIQHSLTGSGFVVHPRERSLLRSCSFAGRKFPDRCPPDRELFRCSLAADAGQGWGENGVTALVSKELGRLIGARSEPVLSEALPVRANRPQLLPGHLEKMQNMKNELERLGGVALCGSYVEGPGVPECIRSARQAAQTITDFLAGPRPAISRYLPDKPVRAEAACAGSYR